MTSRNIPSIQLNVNGGGTITYFPERTADCSLPCKQVHTVQGLGVRHDEGLAQRWRWTAMAMEFFLHQGTVVSISLIMQTPSFEYIFKTYVTNHMLKLNIICPLDPFGLSASRMRVMMMRSFMGIPTTRFFPEGIGRGWFTTSSSFSSSSKSYLGRWEIDGLIGGVRQETHGNSYM